MKPQAKAEFILRKVAFVSLCVFIGLLAACGGLEKPKTEEFYSETKPPRSQEFRWTNGQTPKSFDPAKASAPPETDFARALYEGLTDTQQKTLKPIPAIATEWSSSEDKKVWTFKLRKNAKWSNEKSVTAEDFVRSWKRLSEMGDDVPHHELLKNIVGMRRKKTETEKNSTDVFTEAKPARPQTPRESTKAEGNDKLKGQKTPIENNDSKTNEKKPADKTVVKAEKPEKVEKLQTSRKLGVEAIGNFELKVSLIQPDKDFPKLVAHPVFRPVYANGEEFEKDARNTEIVTNGAFGVESVAEKGITLKRSETYWNKGKVKLEKVTFVPTKDADSALKAYRDGEVDAVTNAKFEPLALKLLTPYFDFRRVTHSALNLYEFNRQKEPFNDRRVREALALAIERERLTEDEMDGATKPAHTYLPFGENDRKGKFEHNKAKAQDLLEKAGFGEGEGFPTIRLVVNRNNVQQRIAKAVAKMWERDLNIKTEIILKEFDELETAKQDGDFDILRRGVVLPTADETANMLAIFKPVKLLKDKDGESKKLAPSAIDNKRTLKSSETDSPSIPESTNPSEAPEATDADSLPSTGDVVAEDLFIDVGEDNYILTEEEALLEVPGIPLYFPTSYSLVKPYVRGFEMNTLDAPSLMEVEIDSNWQPETGK